MKKPKIVLKLKILTPKIGDVVILNSSDWRVWTGKVWRKLNVEEQLALA